MFYNMTILNEENFDRSATVVIKRNLTKWDQFLRYACLECKQLEHLEYIFGDAHG